MPDRGVALSASAIRLLLDLADDEPPLLSATAFDLLPEARELHRAGLLREAGHEMVVASQIADGEEPIEVFADEDDGFGRFSTTDGWVDVPPKALSRWELDVDRLVGLIVPNAMPPVVVIDRTLWKLGGVRVPGRASLVECWFARRVARRWAEVAVSLPALQPRGKRVVLTTSAAPPNEVRMAAIVLRLADVVASDLSIDSARMAARADSRPPSTDRLIVRGNGAEVELDRVVHRFTKGAKQRQVIVYLAGALRGGRKEVAVAEVMEELSISSPRLRDVFKDHATWQGLLFEKGGMCGFRLDD